MVWHILCFETAGSRGLRGVGFFSGWWGAEWRCGRCSVVAGVVERRLGIPSLAYRTPVSIIDHCPPLTNNRNIGPRPRAQRDRQIGTQLP